MDIETQKLIINDYYHIKELVFSELQENTGRIQKLGAEINILFLTGWVGLFLKAKEFPNPGIISCLLHCSCLLILIYLLWDNLEVGKKALEMVNSTHHASSE